MTLLTTVVLLFLNLAASLGMAWWLKSLLESLVLFVLMGLGAFVFYLEESESHVAWRAHTGYWAVSLMNIMGLYMATKASGFLLVLLVINLFALLRALSRLDAQSAGIVWPVTEAGLSREAMQGGSFSGAGQASILQEPGVVVEDEPGVQVELETYKNGENAVPMVRTAPNINALMRRVSANLRLSKATRRKGKTAVPKQKARKTVSHRRKR